jgi:heterodisulfide reductase subunit C
MAKIYEALLKDIRFQEGLNACMNCGVCTAVCPAAAFYKYDPRQICDIVQSKEEQKLEELLKSDTIWYCGQCMSCKPRCPRGNVPGLVIAALRKISQEQGRFTQSEKGRQQFVIKRVVGHAILENGYCVYPDMVTPEKHPEQGPVWKWYYEHVQQVSDKLGANYKRPGPGALRLIAEENMTEIRKIFEVTGGTDLQTKIETFSKAKAAEMGFVSQKEVDEGYADKVYTENEKDHQR